MPGEQAIALPEGYATRSARDQDAEAIVALMCAFDTSFDVPDRGLDGAAIRANWASIDLERDTWVVEAADGAIVAYGEINDIGSGTLISDGYVHPHHRGRGIGTALVRLMEFRARELIAKAPIGAQVTLSNGVLQADTGALALLEREGYALERTFYEMRITLTEAPNVPALPDGLRLRAFVPEQDERAVFETVESAFADHWNHPPRQFDEWIARRRHEGIEPALWLVVEAPDGSIPAVSLGVMRDGLGFINIVATLREWRGKGLAGALLRASFRAYWDRGTRVVALGVDAHSPTGATRVYEAAGMVPVLTSVVFQKTLRDGVDLTARPRQTDA